MAQSGRKTVTTAGAQESLVAASQIVNGPVAIKAIWNNSDVVFVGDSTVSSANGYELSAKEEIIIPFVGDLINIWIDSAIDGEGVTWLALNY